MIRPVLLALSALGLWAGEVNRSPQDIAFSPDGSKVVVADHTAACLVVLDASGKPGTSIALAGKPAGIGMGQDRVFISLQNKGAIAVVDLAKGSVEKNLTIGGRPQGLAVSPDGTLLLVADSGRHLAQIVDIAGGKVLAEIPAGNCPRSAAISADGAWGLVASALPSGDARSSDFAAKIIQINLKTNTKICEIQLASGTTNVKSVAISPDGKWGYAVHTLGRYTLPTTQLERGWVNTNALTIVDIAAKKVYATLLLDTLTNGAADPWGLALSPDGKRAFIAISGLHEAVDIDLASLHLMLDGKAVTVDGKPRAIPADSVWSRFLSGGKTSAAPAPKKGAAPTPAPTTPTVAVCQAACRVSRRLVPTPAPTTPTVAVSEIRASLQNDLSALYISGTAKRFALPLVGPRGVAVSAKQVAIAGYFSGDVVISDWDKLPEAKAIPVGPKVEASQARRGEQAFFDGRGCFQGWLSCGTCHPEARADGLNWDLLNDGMGNPKNTKTMVWSDRTPPMMSLGVRENMEAATKKGFMVIQFQAVSEATLEDTRAYLRTLDREPSPYLVNGKLSAKAEKGKKIYEDPKVGCALCHPGPLFTDLKPYDVGTSDEKYGDAKDSKFDTTQLVDLWATAPYLHHGAAPTMMDVLTTHNKEDKHGCTSKLSKEELDALVEYLLSL